VYALEKPLQLRRRCVQSPWPASAARPSRPCCPAPPSAWPRPARPRAYQRFDPVARLTASSNLIYLLNETTIRLCGRQTPRPASLDRAIGRGPGVTAGAHVALYRQTPPRRSQYACQPGSRSSRSGPDLRQGPPGHRRSQHGRNWRALGAGGRRVASASPSVYLSYRLLVRTIVNAAISVLAAVASAVGGAAVTGLFRAGKRACFAWYAIGLLAGNGRVSSRIFGRINGLQHLAAVLSVRKRGAGVSPGSEQRHRPSRRTARGAEEVS